MVVLHSSPLPGGGPPERQSWRGQATKRRAPPEPGTAPYARRVQPSSYVLTLSCPDRPGIVHAVSGVLADAGGNITESQQFGDPGTGRFMMRVQADVAPAGRA